MCGDRRARGLIQISPAGTFLLRDSAQDKFVFSVSFVCFKRVLHAR